MSRKTTKKKNLVHKGLRASEADDFELQFLQQPLCVTDVCMDRRFINAHSISIFNIENDFIFTRNQTLISSTRGWDSNRKFKASLKGKPA